MVQTASSPNGDGTFQPGVDYPMGDGGGLTVAYLTGDGIPDIITTAWEPAGEAPVSVAVADFGSQIMLPDGSAALGPPDGHPDIIVAASTADFPTTTPGFLSTDVRSAGLLCHVLGKQTVGMPAFLP